MSRRGPVIALAAVVLLVCAPLAPQAPVMAQHDVEDSVAQPVPPPMPPKPPPGDEVPEYEPILQDSDAPWGLPDDLLKTLYGQADVYTAYTNRFVCDEAARIADYNNKGEVSSEEIHKYGYLLIKDPSGRSIREYRGKLSKDGTTRAEVKDEESFPPAYAWVFMFSRFNEPYFSYRLVSDRFEGFDWILEIQFKGSIPFTDGRDIRQWEGTVYLDAVTHTPVEIHAEPLDQRDRVEALYRRYQQSFNILGFRTKPKPKGYRAHIQFRHRKDGLTFPTEVRYDTFLSVSLNQVVPTKASTRVYTNYRITDVETTPEVGDPVQKP